MKKNLGKLIKNPIFFIILSIFILANSSSHPTNSSGGYTGAPGDGVCAQCHGGSNPNFNGDIEISGLPATISPSTAYNITVTVTNPNGNATRTGFQMVALNASNTQAGTFSSPSASSNVKTSGGKQYHGHAPAVPFNGANPVTWSVTWTSPASGSGTITLYAASILGNGSGSSGDKFVSTQASGTFVGGVPLSANITGVQHVSCFQGNNGQATANASGGNPPYSYLWNNGETTMTATSLPAGTATVVVTDNSGNTTSASTTINQPPAIANNFTAVTNPTCFNTTNGKATANPSGGTPPFTYLWGNGETTKTATMLPGGVTTLEITDNKGCKFNTSITLTSPPPIVVINSNIINPICAGTNTGSISLSASGGTGSLTYSWSNGASGSSISNLSAGTYIVTIKDANNCESQETYSLTAPPAININFATNAACAGSSNGSATANASGGVPPYTYQWSSGANTQTASNLSSGSYSVTVVDANQCSKVGQVNVPSFPIMSISTNTTNASCLGVNNGSASVSVSGGSPGYQYLWNTGATTSNITNLGPGTYEVTVTDQKGCTAFANAVVGANTSAALSLVSQQNLLCFGGNNGSATVALTNGAGYNLLWSNGASGTSVNNLSAGTYTAQATNPNGCQSNTVTVTITQPADINPNPTIVQPLCSGSSNGSIVTNYSGGTGTLTYLWNNGASTPNLENVSAGSFSVLVTDQNGCTDAATFNLVNPPAINISGNSNNVLCNGGSTGAININVQGGTGQYNYSWSNGQSTQNIGNLTAGSYTVSVYDQNQCSQTNTFTISQPLPIDDNEVIVNETTQGANNGSITTNVTGGTQPYSYLWSNGSTNSSIQNLPAGAYSLTVTDSLGCTASFSYNIQSGGCALIVTSIANHVLCNGSATGSVLFDITNGTGPYTINPNPNNLSAGTYSFTITDNAGCTFQVNNIVILQPPALTSVLDSIQNATGPNQANGKIYVSITGGAAPYTYIWKDSLGNVVSNVEDPINLLPGTYTLTAFDKFECPIPTITATVSFKTNVNSEVVDLIKIFPNPASDVLFIESQTDMKFSLYGSDGKIIMNNNLDKGINKVDLSNIQAGKYLLKVSNGNDFMTKLILITK